MTVPDINTGWKPDPITNFTLPEELTINGIDDYTRVDQIVRNGWIVGYEMSTIITLVAYLDKLNYYQLADRVRATCYAPEVLQRLSPTPS